MVKDIKYPVFIKIEKFDVEEVFLPSVETEVHKIRKRESSNNVSYLYCLRKFDEKSKLYIENKRPIAAGEYL